MKTYKNSQATTVKWLPSQSEYERASQSNNAHKAQYPLPKAETDQRQKNRLLSTPQLLELLHAEAKELWEIARVVGRWVWVNFDKKPSPECTGKLKNLGFRWNKKRQCWQHPCGDTRSAAANYDPRERYGSRPVTELETAK